MPVCLVRQIVILILELHKGHVGRRLLECGLHAFVLVEMHTLIMLTVREEQWRGDLFGPFDGRVLLDVLASVETFEDEIVGGN